MRRTTLFKTTLMCVLGIALVGCSHFKSKDTVGPVPVVTQQQGKVEVLWKQGTLAKTKQYVRLAPRIDGDVLFAADHKGRIIALNKNTGKTIWQIQTRQPLSAGPSIVGDVVLVGTGSGRVFAYHKNNGKLKWKTAVASEVLAPPNGSEEVILVNTVDGKLTALDYETGHTRWMYDRTPPALILRRSATPQIVGDLALAGFSSGKLIALSKETGVVVWERLIADPKGRSELHRMVDIALDPYVEGDRVYVGSMKGNVVALNVRSGGVIWQKDIPSYQNFAVDESKLYLTDSNHNLVALDKSEGSVLWRQEKLAKRPLTAPGVTEQFVVVGDELGMLYWFDKSTGKLEGLHKINKDLMSDPIISDNKLYLQGQNGTLAALRILPGRS